LSGARSLGIGPFDTLAPQVRLQPQEDWLGFLDANGELYAAPTDALHAPQRVNESSHGVDIDFVLGRERIVYRAGKDTDPFAFELYARPYASLGLARRR
jgi:hypothetical protein